MNFNVVRFVKKVYRDRNRRFVSAYGKRKSPKSEKPSFSQKNPVFLSEKLSFSVKLGFSAEKLGFTEKLSFSKRKTEFF